MISGFSTCFPIATIFWNRYRSLMVTWLSNTLMGNVSAALTDRIRSSRSARSISSAVSFLPKTTSQYESPNPMASTSPPRMKYVTRNIPLSLAHPSLSPAARKRE